MPPFLALILWLVLLLALLWFDPAKVKGVSPALWIPVIWIFFSATRLPSQWIGGHVGQAAEALLNGNPIDRTVDLILIGLAVMVLISRQFDWGGFLGRNIALTLYLSFALASVFWSDFSFVSFKHWVRDFGDYLVVLVVLSDPRPEEAMVWVLRRLGYLLIPLSILLDKYFPALSRTYAVWTGAVMFVGPTTGKNLLGLLALLCGLFFFWDLVALWGDRKNSRTKRMILVDIPFFVMSLSLLISANSATCRICMIMGCLVILGAHSHFLQKRSWLLKTSIPLIYLAYLILAFGLGMSGNMAAAVGKDPTLTDRTKIWSVVLGMHTNPLLGTGYASFWMGPRLEYFWRNALVGINEAHNGYLEVYLNLGLIGVALAIGILIGAFIVICRRFRLAPGIASLSLAIWTVMLFFTITEASFRSGMMWLVFLMIGLDVRRRAEVPGRIVVKFPISDSTNRSFHPARVPDSRTIPSS